MAGGNVSRSQQRSVDRDPVEGYLAAVAARLAGPPAARAAITDELRDGLLETLKTHRTQGSSPQEATATAIEEFGDPATVAAAFARSSQRSRRVGSLWPCWPPARWSG
jgi:HAAS